MCRSCNEVHPVVIVGGISIVTTIIFMAVFTGGVELKLKADRMATENQMMLKGCEVKR